MRDLHGANGWRQRIRLRQAGNNAPGIDRGVQIGKHTDERSAQWSQINGINADQMQRNQFDVNRDHTAVVVEWISTLQTLDDGIRVAQVQRIQRDTFQGDNAQPNAGQINLSPRL